MVQVRNVPRSIAFYQKLGFAERNSHMPEGEEEPVWAWLSSEGAHLMLSFACDPVEPSKQGILFYLYCEDVSSFRDLLIERGVEAGPINYPFYAPRGEFSVTDLDGYTLMITHT